MKKWFKKINLKNKKGDYFVASVCWLKPSCPHFSGFLDFGNQVVYAQKKTNPSATQELLDDLEDLPSTQEAPALMPGEAFCNMQNSEKPKIFACVRNGQPFPHNKPTWVKTCNEDYLEELQHSSWIRELTGWMEPVKVPGGPSAEDKKMRPTGDESHSSICSSPYATESNVKEPSESEVLGDEDTAGFDEETSVFEGSKTNPIPLDEDTPNERAPAEEDPATSQPYSRPSSPRPIQPSPRYSTVSEDSRPAPASPRYSSVSEESDQGLEGLDLNGPIDEEQATLQPPPSPPRKRRWGYSDEESNPKKKKKTTSASSQ